MAIPSCGLEKSCVRTGYCFAAFFQHNSCCAMKVLLSVVSALLLASSLRLLSVVERDR